MVRPFKPTIASHRVSLTPLEPERPGSGKDEIWSAGESARDCTGSSAVKVHNEAKSTALEFDLNIRILYPWGLLPEAHRGATARDSQVSRAAMDRRAPGHFAFCWTQAWRASGVASLLQSGLFCCLCWTHSFFA